MRVKTRLEDVGAGFKPAPTGEPRSCRLENVICAEFIEHDIMFLSELLRNMSIDIGCPSCTSLLEGLMAIRRDLKKELLSLKRK